MSHIYENDTKPILSDPPYLLQFILSVVLSVLCGATIMFMWNWFVVPLGLPMIGLVQALGLDTLITFIVTTRVNTTPPRSILGSLDHCYHLCASHIVRRVAAPFLHVTQEDVIMDTQMVLTHTGKIYFNRSLGLEFLTVGDYGKENNIKADFLGLTKRLRAFSTTTLTLWTSGLRLSAARRDAP